MELKHTEELENRCCTIAVDKIKDTYYIALGMCADVRVYEYGFEDDYSCFPECWPEFSLEAADRSLCYWDEEEDDIVDFNQVVLRNRHLLFTVHKKLYIWDWVKRKHLHTVDSDYNILYFGLKDNLLVLSGYKDLQLWTASYSFKTSGTLVAKGKVAFRDKYKQFKINDLDWRINQHVQMEMVLETNQTLQAAVDQFEFAKITAFNYDNITYFAGVAKNGMSFIKRVDMAKGITASRAVSNGRFVSCLVVHNNMLCSMDIKDVNPMTKRFYFCNYDAVTLLPIHQQCVYFQNNGFDWVDMVIADNHVLVCGDSSSLLHVFETKYWDKDAVSTFLMCLRRKEFLPELTADFLIPFLFAIKFDKPDNIF